MLSPDAVLSADQRIGPYIRRTPLMTCALLNGWVGHEVYFKVEGFQKIGAFKIRGALNALLALKEEDALPERMVAFSSGNHAQAVALAGKMLGVQTTVIMPKFVSRVKQQATRGYGAELILTDTRQQAEALAQQKQAEGAWLLHPSADDRVIAGQGTACLEALEDGPRPDAIFATCGGGGLLSGTWLAAQLLAPTAQVFGAEPALANDAAQSYRSGEIMAFSETPMTIADGARTLHVSELTFQYLRQLNGFFEAEEKEIIYWTQWLQHLLKAVVEPTAATAMAAAAQWLATQDSPRRVLVILSGGNIDAASHQQIWKTDYLDTPPAL
jgi:threo-3-hydroxy-L-aspartate ammonia-lyase